MADNSSAGRVPAANPPLWRRIAGTRIGIVPLSAVAFITVATIILDRAGRLPADIMINIVILAVGGFACAELGKRLPYINRIGSAAVFATFIPSYLVYRHLLPDAVVHSITDFTRQSNFLYLFISVIIVGSILEMDRRTLISSMLKIVLPLGLGTLAATAVGMGVGVALGLNPRHTLFYVVLPVMAGGVGEGALPLAAGYAAAGDANSLAELLPAVMLGSLTAILFSGGLNLLGKRRPHLTGEGILSSADRQTVTAHEAQSIGIPPSDVGAAIVMTACLYLAGLVCQTLWHWPGPVIMLALVVLMKLGNLVSVPVELGATAAYRFFRVNMTYPLLFAIGVAMTPWANIVAAFQPARLVTIAATVIIMMATAFYTGRWLGLYPIDTAIVAACHCGQGGTGSIAILTAANRLGLMPFAQIATRIAGAVVVSLALLAYAQSQ